MAIYSSVPPPAQQVAAPSVDIEAWTMSALESLSVSPTARGTGVTLSIPLDSSRDRDNAEIGKTAYRPHKEPVRRDSLKRREALLKGKEGSRRRQRWENGKEGLLGRECGWRTLADEYASRSSPPRTKRPTSPPK